MSVTQGQIGELVAKVFDRLEDEYEGHVTLDAVLLVEVLPNTDPDESDLARGIVLMETTADRVTSVMGIVEMARDSIGDSSVNPEDV